MKSKKSIPFFIIIAVLAGYFAVAQESKKDLKQNKKQEIPKFSYIAEVILTNVDVIATDKSGRPFTGLKSDYSEIYEDGFI